MLSPRSAFRLRFRQHLPPLQACWSTAALCQHFVSLGGAYLLRAFGAQRSQGTAVLKLSSSPAPGKALGVQWVQRWHVGHTTSVHHTGPRSGGPHTGFKALLLPS